MGEVIGEAVVFLLVASLLTTTIIVTFILLGLNYASKNIKISRFRYALLASFILSLVWLPIAIFWAGLPSVFGYPTYNLPPAIYSFLNSFFFKNAIFPAIAIILLAFTLKKTSDLLPGFKLSGWKITLLIATIFVSLPFIILLAFLRLMIGF